jgi:hypothetical protein
VLNVFKKLKFNVECENVNLFVVAEYDIINVVINDFNIFNKVVVV